MEDALRANGIKPKPGDFVAVDIPVIKQERTKPFHAVSGRVAADMDTEAEQRRRGQTGDGSAIEEPSETAEESIPYRSGKGADIPRWHCSRAMPTVKEAKTSSVSSLTTESRGNLPTWCAKTFRRR